MRNGISLGRILGVPVRLDWSLLLIAGFLTFNLAAYRYPFESPGSGVVAYLVAGVATAALFFGSVLAHELAHSVVSQRNGTPVRGITLWLLGGMAQLGGEPRSPGAEFRIAAAGPVTSFGLAAGFGSLWAVAGELGLPGLVGSALGWLALINLVLGLFNLVPGAPLDGGRILASALWAWHGDRDRAAEGAARAGTIVGGLLVAFGVLQFLFGFAGGLWSALVGWFVINAARAEGDRARQRRQVAATAAAPWPISPPGRL